MWDEMSHACIMDWCFSSIMVASAVISWISALLFMMLSSVGVLGGILSGQRMPRGHVDGGHLTSLIFVRGLVVWRGDDAFTTLATKTVGKECMKQRPLIIERAAETVCAECIVSSTKASLIKKKSPGALEHRSYVLGKSSS